MSFNDLERGLGQRAPLAGASNFSREAEEGDPIDKEFQGLITKVSTHIFRINSNVSGLSKLIDLLGSSRDTGDLRKKLHDLNEATREFIKNSSLDAKKLASWPATDSYKIEQNKVSRDYASSIQAFQKVSRVSVEKQKQFVDRVVKSSNLPVFSSSSKLPNQQLLIQTESEGGESHELSETRREGSEQQQQQQQQQQQRPSQERQQKQVPDREQADLESDGELVGGEELEYQLRMIRERESEIREIEVGIHELNEIFRDLGTIVQEQGGQIDNIESNVHRINSDMRSTVVELTQAHQYQKRAGKKLFCLLVLFIVILIIILIAVFA